MLQCYIFIVSLSDYFNIKGDENSTQFFYDSKALQKKRKSGDQGGGEGKKHGE